MPVTQEYERGRGYGILPYSIDNTRDDAFGQRIVSTMYTTLNQYLPPRCENSHRRRPKATLHYPTGLPRLVVCELPRLGEKLRHAHGSVRIVFVGDPLGD
jgi:hypothetical protein